MRKDQLLVTTQGVRGGKQHTNQQGMVRATVTKGFNAPEFSIEINVFKPSEAGETALLNLTFPDRQRFDGTVAELQASLGSTPELLKERDELKEKCHGYHGALSETLAEKRRIESLNAELLKQKNELLEALKGLYKYVESDGKEFSHSRGNALIAIFKAEGRATV